MITVDIDQRSEEWFSLRCGIPTASNFDKLVTNKGEPSKQTEAYILKLAGERILGHKEESYQSTAMARGAELEAQARVWYNFINDVEIKEVGMVYKDEERLCSGSPDGLIEENRGVEIKCPLVHTHVEYLLSPKKLVSKYYQQIQGYLYLTGRELWVAYSYYPGMKDVIVDVERDEKFIEKLDEAIKKASKEIAEIVEKIR